MVRRDNTLYCSQTMEKFVTALLKENDLDKALDIVRKAVFDLVNGHVSYTLLTQSKSKQSYAVRWCSLAIRLTMFRLPSRALKDDVQDQGKYRALRLLTQHTNLTFIVFVRFPTSPC